MSLSTSTPPMVWCSNKWFNLLYHTRAPSTGAPFTYMYKYKGTMKLTTSSELDINVFMKTTGDQFAFKSSFHKTKHSKIQTGNKFRCKLIK